MQKQQTALVCGAGGFIGSHLVKRLKAEGFWVRGVDLKHPEFAPTQANEFIIGDLRQQQFCEQILDKKFNHVYQLAADMGGAGYIFTGENDADVMYNSAQINLHVLNRVKQTGVDRIFYSSSACIYPAHNQENPQNPLCTEHSAYPANPDSEYGWEKLFSERLYLSHLRNYGIPVRIARFHNIFGTESTWQGGKEKAPAALCRKVALASNGEHIEIWGSGQQTRSFLFIDECLDGIRKLTEGNWEGPVNIGSEEMITINGLAEMVITLSGKNISIKNIEGPVGVMGRNSDNHLIFQQLNWKPTYPLIEGMRKTYQWVAEQVGKRGV